VRCKTKHWIGILLLAAVGTAHAAVQCLAPDKTIAFIKGDSKELSFIDAQPDGDTQFALPGEDYRRDADVDAGRIQFVLDGLRYGFRTTAVDEFVSPDLASDAREILPRYAAWIQEQVVKGGTSFQTFQELDRTLRPAYESTPAIYLLRWRLGPADNKDVRGVYYLSAVLGSRVASVAVVVEKPEQLARAQAGLSRFATSFRLLEPDDPCPVKAKP